ncbi:MAG: DUF4249 family protein, partial [Bacteroidales bacterium]
MKHLLKTGSNIFLSTLIVSYFLSTSCENNDNFLNLENLPPSALCLTGFVTPDSIYLVLNRSVPYNFSHDGSNPYLLGDIGIIWVEENGVFFDTLQPKTMQITDLNGNSTKKIYYTSSKKPKEGKTYRIHAQYAGFDKVEANIFVPHGVTILRFDTATYFKAEKIPIDVNFPFGEKKDTLYRY